MINLSVIIPVYGTEEFLERALTSVCACTLEKFEIIIIDDASPGDCSSIIQKYQSGSIDVRYIRHPRNKGTLVARMSGTMVARGEYIAYLDPDDWIVNDIYTQAYNHALKNHLEIVWFNFTNSDETGRFWDEKQNRLPQWEKESGAFFLKNIFSNVSRSRVWHVNWNKLIKTEVAQNVFRSMRVRIHLNMYEDLLWSIALFSYLEDRQTIGMIEKTGLIYYRHSKSITKRKDFQSYVGKYHNMIRIIKSSKVVLAQYGLTQRYTSIFEKMRCFLLYNFSPWRQQHQGLYEWVVLWGLRIQHSLLWNGGCIEYDPIGDEIVTVVDKVKTIGIPEVGIFGTGDFAIRLSMELMKQGFKTILYISTDPLMVSKKINGIRVVEIEEGLHDCKVICISSVGAYGEIAELIRSKSLDNVPLLVTVE